MIRDTAMSHPLRARPHGRRGDAAAAKMGAREGVARCGAPLGARLSASSTAEAILAEADLAQLVPRALIPRALTKRWLIKRWLIKRGLIKRGRVASARAMRGDLGPLARPKQAGHGIAPRRRASLWCAPGGRRCGANPWRGPAHGEVHDGWETPRHVTAGRPAPTDHRVVENIVSDRESACCPQDGTSLYWRPPKPADVVRSGTAEESRS
jgi:hypothetical protein